MSEILLQHLRFHASSDANLMPLADFPLSSMKNPGPEGQALRVKIEIPGLVNLCGRGRMVAGCGLRPQKAPAPALFQGLLYSGISVAGSRAALVSLLAAAAA